VELLGSVATPTICTWRLFLGSLVFQFVLWGVVGTVAAIAAIAFLTRYKKGN
jgi:hypothetical protein